MGCRRPQHAAVSKDLLKRFTSLQVINLFIAIVLRVNFDESNRKAEAIYYDVMQIWIFQQYSATIGQ